jgi:hypothetical protein
MHPAKVLFFRSISSQTPLAAIHCSGSCVTPVLLLLPQAQEGASLEDVMSRQIICVTENIALEQLTNTFKKVSGVCVVDEEKRLIGVVSRKDISREGVSAAARVLAQSCQWANTLLAWWHAGAARQA